MKSYKKADFPIEKVRRFIEPGPVVLVSSAWKNKRDIMTMGWHMIMEFSPSLIGCYIWDQNYSQELALKSKECVINIPEAHLASTVAKIGNCSGRDEDKFEKFGLTAREGTRVKTPLIEECYANLECRLYESRMVKKWSFFIWEVVKAHAPKTPRYPQTLHYRGDGQFMVAGPNRSLRRLFRPELLD